MDARPDPDYPESPGGGNLKSWLVISILTLAVITGTAVFYFGFHLFDQGALLSQRQDPRQNPQLVPCQGVSELANLKISSSVLMNGEFVSKDSMLTEQGEDAAREQLRFLPAALETGPLSNIPRNVRFFLSAQSPDIVIGNVDPHHYKYSLKPSRPAEVDEDDAAYVQKASKRGFTAEGDPGFEVTFEASVRTAVCWGGIKRRLKSVSVSLPVDPYLAFWQPMSTSSKSTGGRKGALQTKAKISISPVQPGESFDSFAEPFKEGNDPIRMTMIFGAEETPDHPPDVDELGGFLAGSDGEKRGAKSAAPADTTGPDGKMTPLQQGAAKFLEAADHWDKESRPDATALAFAEFLAKLPSVLEADNTSLEKQGHHLIVDVTGWLKLSQRPVSIRAYFGLTDVHGTTPAEHWPYVLESLSKDDALTYSGPLGMGDDLSLAVMREALGMQPEALVAAGTRTPHFLFGVVSGGAYSQVGADVAELRSQTTGLGTDTILVASGEDRPQLNLAILRYLDRAIQGDAGDESAALTSYLGPSDMVVLEHHAGGAAPAKPVSQQ